MPNSRQPGKRRLVAGSLAAKIFPSGAVDFGESITRNLDVDAFTPPHWKPNLAQSAANDPCPQNGQVPKRLLNPGQP